MPERNSPGAGGVTIVAIVVFSIFLACLGVLMFTAGWFAFEFRLVVIGILMCFLSVLLPIYVARRNLFNNTSNVDPDSESHQDVTKNLRIIDFDSK